jgi:hypothetical protein
MKLYKITCTGTSLLFVFLFIQLFLSPVSFVENLGLQSNVGTSILCRRASIFMLGLSVLLFCARKLPHSSIRQSICLSTGIIMTGLACLSSFELLQGTVNNSMWTAIILETLSATLFWITFFRNTKKQTDQTQIS